ncbi:glycosyltransferase family 4 protein [Mangrovivirga sp. M17]|uniref:Glycosyltransferase family 4 protein n=1 Tax=Mangrovivirga halotolerans TaxID=2993936 RepID=A0ABT3RUF4_9BACT|nr:glycosyltransferase family 4 protein [Mangrovivirga halotolerans]MCX2744877.1 glycosyltransferase family 4 protein [Mangrovivirga halotolerans]
MKVLYIHQYYRTPEEGGATRSYYLSKAMIKSGHDVTLITSHNKSHKAERNIDGVKVIYLPVKYNNSFGFYRRITSFLLFARLVVKEIRNQDPETFDLCYATSTPLTVGWAAIQIKDKYQVPFIFEVRDLWPEAPIQLGIIRNPFLKIALRTFEKYIYEQSIQIIALSPNMVEEIKKIVPWKDVKMIPNFSDPDLFRGKRRSLFNKEKIVISYFGAAGYVNGLQTILNCAVKVKSDKRIIFKIMVRGAVLNSLKKRAQRDKLNNIEFLEYGGKENVVSLLEETSFSFISFLPKKVLGSNSPNKFFDSLAAGVPVIVNTKGWTSELVEEYRCGFYHKFDDTEEFQKQLDRFLNDPSLYAYASENALFLANNYFKREKVIRKLLIDLEQFKEAKPELKLIRNRA